MQGDGCIAAKCNGNVRAALMDLELKLLVTGDSQPAVKTCPIASNGEKRMKRILVKVEGKWTHQFVPVSA